MRYKSGVKMWRRDSPLGLVANDCFALQRLILVENPERKQDIDEKNGLVFQESCLNEHTLLLDQVVHFQIDAFTVNTRLLIFPNYGCFIKPYFAGLIK